MGAWGVKALESDEGLDLVDFLTDNFLPEHTQLCMDEMIDVLKRGGFFGDTFGEIDFFYDHSAMALAELYLEWLDTGKLEHDSVDEDNGETPVWELVTRFTASTAALDFLLRYLHDIRNEVPDDDGEREIVELWRENGENPNWESWSRHLDILIKRLEQQRGEAV